MDNLKKEAKTYLTYSGKVNSRVKENLQKELIEKVQKIYPFCRSFSEAMYLILKVTKESDYTCTCGKIKQFYRYSGGYFKSCGSSSCKFEDREAWNKGLTKDNDERIAKYSDTLSKVKKGKEQSESQKVHVKNMIKNNTGRKKTKEEIEKQRKTNLERYGVPSVLCLSNNRKKAKKALFDKYGGYYSSSKEFQEKKDEMIKKMKKTCKERYKNNE